MSYQKFGASRGIQARSFKTHAGPEIVSGNGFPSSGPTGTTVYNGVGATAGSLYLDEDSGVQFSNEGTAASPYWTPISMQQANIVGIRTDFAGGVGRLGTATTASSQDANLPGLRYFGAGIEENDATNTVQAITYPVGGPLLTMITENQADKVTALGYGHTTALWVPATNGVMVIDASFTAITDILTRSIFLGFTGESAEAMAPAVAGATVTMTFNATGTQGDNVHGMFMDSRLTAASSIFLPSVKANAVASVSTTVAALTTASVVEAAATYQRWRLEIDASGNIRAFKDKVQVHYVAAGASTSVALSPAFAQSNTTTTAALSLGVRRFGTWARRA